MKSKPLLQVKKTKKTHTRKIKTKLLSKWKLKTWIVHQCTFITRTLPVAYWSTTGPWRHWVQLIINTPRRVAFFISLIRSSRLLGAFPEPYVCKTTPSMGGFRNALTCGLCDIQIRCDKLYTVNTIKDVTITAVGELTNRMWFSVVSV